LPQGIFRTTTVVAKVVSILRRDLHERVVDHVSRPILALGPRALRAPNSGGYMAHGSQGRRIHSPPRHRARELDPGCSPPSRESRKTCPIYQAEGDRDRLRHDRQVAGHEWAARRSKLKLRHCPRPVTQIRSGVLFDRKCPQARPRREGGPSRPSQPLFHDSWNLGQVAKRSDERHGRLLFIQVENVTVRTPDTGLGAGNSACPELRCQCADGSQASRAEFQALLYAGRQCERRGA
jgi:hypothetical protein